MPNRWLTSRRSPRRSGCPDRGLTLIEVVAALLVLGVLLAGVLAAKDRARRQWRAADRQIEAVTALDNLLTDWTSITGFAFAPGAGRVAGHDEWRWVVTLSDRRDAAALRCRVATVAIVDAAGQVLADAELLAPIAVQEKPKEEQTS